MTRSSTAFMSVAHQREDFDLINRLTSQQSFVSGIGAAVTEYLVGVSKQCILSLSQCCSENSNFNLDCQVFLPCMNRLCSTNIENSTSKSVISFRTFAFIRVMEGAVDSPLVRLSGPEQSPDLKRGEGKKQRDRELFITADAEQRKAAPRHKM
ncbi:hypothetical protein TNIN_377631 [Trichonephila inaurata madagascariensis]|uniref:Uncharacterized protein n=1 Tax=Trichonephila inaurata madagascariensis TaxID=2747483 RepID=A0A8X6YD71_9ARAC|nr:hypothetical protein TNIN_377631 [Trichonephila inaurata madagascariensis]